MYKCFNVSLITLCMLVPGIALADEVDMNLETAQQVVEDYKDLRRQCSASRGEIRRQCFNQLSSANTHYQKAKKVIVEDGGNKDSVHYISFAQ